MKKFQTIIADPPWFFFDRLKQSDVARGAEANYKTMSLSDIKSIPINDVSDPDGCVLGLWVPSSLLQEGLDVMKSWGFVHKQTYIWVKSKKDSFSDLKNNIIKAFKSGDNIKESITAACNQFSLNDTLGFGMGHLFRQTHEVCLIGINNSKIYKSLQNKSQRSVSFAYNVRHSQKPENLQNSLEKMFPDANRLEIFARKNKEGWTCLGNELCNGEDIVTSLKKLYT